MFKPFFSFNAPNGNVVNNHQRLVYAFVCDGREKKTPGSQFSAGGLQSACTHSCSRGSHMQRGP